MRNIHKVYLEDLPKNWRTPFSTYCRKLIKQGYSEEDKLEMYRRIDDILLIHTNNIGETAKWTILENDNIGPVASRFRDRARDIKIGGK